MVDLKENEKIKLDIGDKDLGNSIIEPQKSS